MKTRFIAAILVTVVLAAGTVWTVIWYRSHVRELAERQSDRDATQIIAEETRPLVAGEPIVGNGVPSDVTGEWPCYRGTNRDGISADGPRLARSWPPAGPPVLWSIAVAEGYAGAAVSRGRVYLLDYDTVNKADTLRCLSLDDGREIWRNSYPVVVPLINGITRTVPTIVGDYVITLGPLCHLACWDAHTGDCHWLIDLVEDHGTSVPQYYTGQCPLVDQDRLIIATCGDALLTAIDYKTGEVIWESPNPRKWKMVHGSVVPMQYLGQRSYVYCASGGVAAVAAEDGALLWETTPWEATYLASPAPVVLPEGRILLCRSYGSGCLMVQLAETDEGIEAKPVFELTPKQFSPEQQTPIYWNGHLYGFGSKRMVCLDIEGNQVWSSGSDRFAYGPFMFADGMLLLLTAKGTLTLAEATPSGYKRLARHDVLPDGVEARGPMALVSGRLIVRDMTRMVCLDLTQR